MAFDQEVGQANVRTSIYDKTVKGIAAASYKFKQALTIVPTSAWKNFFYREDPTVLAGGTGNATRGIPRNAEFPHAVPIWERIQATIEKYGLEGNIAWEDTLSDDIDMRDRTLIRIAEGVAYAVDTQIWSALTSDASIQTLTVGKAGAATNSSGSWNESSAAIIDDLENAEALMAAYNYPTENLMVFVSPTDKRYVFKYLIDKGAQMPAIAEGLLASGSNGVIGKLGNFTFVVSNNVTASQALVVVPKRCGTWKELVPLQTTTKEDAYKSITVRAVELGVTEVTDPKAIVLIKGTQK